MPHTVDDYADAFQSFGGNAFDHKHLAGVMLQTRVPIEAVQHINKVRFNQDMDAAGSYRYTDRSLNFQGKPAAMGAGSSERERQMKRLVRHEGHHAMQHMVNGQQFEAAMAPGNSRGRARVEAYAENAADKHVPGSYSSYDSQIARGGRTRFDPEEYKKVRSNFNVAPHLR